MMTPIDSIALALQLVREELTDKPSAISVPDAAAGRIYRELARLPAPEDESDCDDALEGFVRIAATAIEMIAALVADGKEGA